MSRSAMAGGALFAVTGATGLTVAQEYGEDEQTGGNESETETEMTDASDADIEVLNYALALEQLEDAFYKEGLDTFDEQDFVDAVEGGPESQGEMAYAWIEVVGEHESTHAEALSQTIEQLGGTPLEPVTYDFGFESVQEMVELGQTLENTGVAAYAGAAPLIESHDLLRTALSIHSVEARHAAVFNYLVGMSPFPNAFDPALPPAEVLNAVSQFMETVPQDLDGMGGNVTDGNVTDGDGNVTDGNGNVTDDGNVSDGNGNVTDGNDTGTNGNVTDGMNGNDTGTNGNATDGMNGNDTGTNGNGNATGGNDTMGG